MPCTVSTVLKAWQRREADIGLAESIACRSKALLQPAALLPSQALRAVAQAVGVTVPLTLAVLELLLVAVAVTELVLLVVALELLLLEAVADVLALLLAVSLLLAVLLGVAVLLAVLLGLPLLLAVREGVTLLLGEGLGQKVPGWQ